MKLGDVKEILTNPDYVYYLHGTGYDDIEFQPKIIASIFEIGLRASNNSMYWTTVCYGTGNDVKNSWDEMVDDMNNWKHKESKNIIIVRFPMKYLIFGADESVGEKDYAIYNEVTNPKTGQVTRFINPKMVVGCYNSNSEEFLLNPNFEKDLTPETEKLLQEKFEEGLAEYQERLSFVGGPIEKTIPEETQEGSENIPESNWSSFGDEW